MLKLQNTLSSALDGSYRTVIDEESLLIGDVHMETTKRVLLRRVVGSVLLYHMSVTSLPR